MVSSRLMPVKSGSVGAKRCSKSMVNPSQSTTVADCDMRLKRDTEGSRDRFGFVWGERDHDAPLLGGRLRCSRCRRRSRKKSRSDRELCGAFTVPEGCERQVRRPLRIVAAPARPMKSVRPAVAPTL